MGDPFSGALAEVSLTADGTAGPTTVLAATADLGANLNRWGGGQRS